MNFDEEFKKSDSEELLDDLHKNLTNVLTNVEENLFDFSEEEEEEIFHHFDLDNYKSDEAHQKFVTFTSIFTILLIVMVVLIITVIMCTC